MNRKSTSSLSQESNIAQRGGLKRRKPSPLALEARLMFDGAAVAAVVADAPVDGKVLDTVIDKNVATPAAAQTDAAREGAQAVDHSAAKEIVFIDPSVSNWQLLAAGVNPDAEVVMLDPARDGLAQIAETLQGRSGVDAVHIVSHGVSDGLILGATTYTSESIGAYQNEMAAIGKSLTENGDILLYGCEIAQGTAGESFINAVAAMTNADVAASDDATGSSALGADWNLEYKSGTVQTGVVISADAQATYAGELAAALSDSDDDRNIVAVGATGGTTVNIDASVSGLTGFANTRYELTSNPGGLFAIDRDNGRVSVANGKTIPNDAPDSYTLTIRAYKINGGSVSADFTVDVARLTDRDSDANTVAARSAAGTSVNIDVDVSNIDTSVGTRTLYRFLGGKGPDSTLSADDNFRINLTTGEVTLARQVNTARDYNFTVVAYRASANSIEEIGGGTKVVSVQRQFTVTVVPQNEAPVAASVAASANEDGVVTVDFSATDSDGFVASYRVNSLPANGTLYADSALTQAVTTSSVLSDRVYFKPGKDWNGSTSFNYVAIDNKNATSAAAVATVTVNAVNDRPVAADIPDQDVAEGDSLTINVLNGATAGAANEAGQTVSLLSASAQHGTVTLSGGDLTYTPNPDYFGEDIITYSLRDSGGVARGGLDTTTATIKVNVAAVNDAPTINVVADGEFVSSAPIVIRDATWSSSTSADPSSILVDGMPGLITRMNVSLTLTHSWPDDLDILLVGPGGKAIVLMSDAGGSGDLSGRTINFSADTSWTLPDDGSFVEGRTYLPANYGSGDVYPLAPNGLTLLNSLNGFDGTNPNGEWKLFVVDDEHFDTGSISSWSLQFRTEGSDTPTYVEQQDEPVVLNPSLVLGDIDDVELSGATVQIVGRVDGDILSVDAPLGIDVSYNEATGTLQLSGTASLAAYQALLRTVSFSSTSDDPTDGGTQLTREFDWSVIDANGSNANNGEQDSNVITSSLNVTAVNDAPEAVALAVEAGEDPEVPLEIELFATDADGAVESYRIGSLPANGTLYADAAMTIALTAGTDVAGPIVYFKPTADWNGDTSFTYRAFDGEAYSAEETATITITPVNDAPVLADLGALTLPEDTSLDSIDVLSLASAGPADEVAGGQFLSVVSASAEFGTVTVNEDGTLRYEANANYFGPDTITYTLSDNAGDGESLEATGTISVTVAPVNDAPVFGMVKMVSSGKFGSVEPIVIPDAGSAEPSVIAVQGLSGSISSLSVTLTLSHTWPEDLDILLVGPNGRGVILMSDAGSSVDMDGTMITFRAGATSALPFGQIVSGLYLPTNIDVGVIGGADRFSRAPEGVYGTDLSVFNGSDANGEWTLYVVDDAEADLGVIHSWGMRIDTTAEAGLGYVENDAAGVLLNPGLDLSDLDDETLVGATVRITNHVAGDTLTIDAPEGISFDYDAETVTLTLRGEASLADYQAALRSVRFSSTSDDPTLRGENALRTIEWTVTDANSSDASNGQQRTVMTSTLAVEAVNDAPEAFAIETGGDEDTTVIIDLGGKDVDGEVQSYTVTSLPANGVLYADAELTEVVTGESVLSGRVYFRPNADWNGTTSFAYSAVDNSAASSVEKTVTIEIKPVNDAPVAEVEIADQIAVAGVTFELTLPEGAFRDVDAGDRLTYSLRMADGSEVPAWLDINEETGKVTGIAQNSDVANLKLLIVATDQAGAEASIAVNVNVVGTFTTSSTGTGTGDGTTPGFNGPGAYNPLNTGRTSGNTSGNVPDPSALTFTQPSFNPNALIENQPTAAGERELDFSDAQSFELASVDLNGELSEFLTSIPAGAKFSFVLPRSLAQADGRFDFAMFEVNGNDLPDWLHFNEKTGKFYGKAPKEMQGTIRLQLVGKDAQGNDRVFRINLVVDAAGGAQHVHGNIAQADIADGVSDKNAPRGRAGLSDQFKQAVKGNGKGDRLARVATLAKASRAA